jgi:ABC-2 type transport system permease protein
MTMTDNSQTVVHTGTVPESKPAMLGQLSTLLRRECWEHIFGALIAFGLLANAIVAVVMYGLLNMENLNVENLTMDRLAEILPQIILPGMAGVVDMALLLGMFVFSLENLQLERKDGSILFWRSLPVSDELMVVAKLLFLTVVLPLVVFAVILLAQFSVLGLSSFLFSPSSSVFSSLWQQVDMASMALRLLSTLMGQALWYMPAFAWLMFCSAWAPRSIPHLSAFLLPLGIIMVEKILNLPTDISRILLERTPLHSPVGPNVVSLKTLDKEAQLSLAPLLDTDLGALMTNPQLWLGLLVGLLLVLAAAKVRKWRNDAP